MLKPSVAVALMLPVFLSRCVAADESADWKPETEQAALKILRQSRERAGELFRFDVEYFCSRLDGPFGTEERSRDHVYCEDPLGYIFEFRAVDPAYLKCGRKSKSGESCIPHEGRRETWVNHNGRLIILNEEDRTYDSANVPLTGGAFGVALARYAAIPPWLDPSVDWDNLKSQFRIKSAYSTPSLFCINFVLKEPATQPLGFYLSWDVDARLESNQMLMLDRKSLLPKKWQFESPAKIDTLLVYTHFDVDPPRRELQVPLNGYKPRSLPKTTEPAQKPLINGDSLQLTGRVLLWLLL